MKLIKEHLELGEYIYKNREQLSDTIIPWMNLRKLSKKHYENESVWLRTRSLLVDDLNYTVFPHLELPIFLKVVYNRGVYVKINKAGAVESMDRELQKVMRITLTANKRAKAATQKHPALKPIFDRLMLQYEQANLALFGAIATDDELAKIVNMKALKKYITK